MKNPLTPGGIEPRTFRFVAQHLNHCATAVHFRRTFFVFLFINLDFIHKSNQHTNPLSLKEEYFTLKIKSNFPKQTAIIIRNDLHQLKDIRSAARSVTSYGKRRKIRAFLADGVLFYAVHSVHCRQLMHNTKPAKRTMFFLTCSHYNTDNSYTFIIIIANLTNKLYAMLYNT